MLEIDSLQLIMGAHTMEITTEMIKRLRERTGAGMMDCKRALEASSGNMDAAVDFLRKKGAAVAEKRADRVANEGVIVAYVIPEGRTGVMIEVNCETDFVARSTDFMAFATTVAETVAKHGTKDVATVHSLRTSSGKPVQELRDELLAKVGEKVDIRRLTVLQTTDGLISSYIHLGNKIGVLVELTGSPADEETNAVGRNVAMQVAAMNPLVVSREEVDPRMVEREMEIYRTQARNDGKPTQVIDKIASGKLEKFYQEVCLLEQIYIRDSGKTVLDFLKEAGVKSGREILIRRFQRFHLGEQPT